VSLSPREYIRHILDEIDYILSQTPGTDFDTFLKDGTLRRAFVRSLEIIGEAAKRFLRISGRCNRTSSGARSRACGTS
jgi:uncharacterized protein with HEPN domain